MTQLDRIERMLRHIIRPSTDMCPLSESGAHALKQTVSGSPQARCVHCDFFVTWVPPRLRHLLISDKANPGDAVHTE